MSDSWSCSEAVVIAVGSYCSTVVDSVVDSVVAGVFWRWNRFGDRKKDAVVCFWRMKIRCQCVSSASSTLSACSQSRLPPAGPNPRASSGRRVRSDRPPLQFVLLRSSAPLHVSQATPLCHARQKWPVAATPILVGCGVVHTN